MSLTINIIYKYNFLGGFTMRLEYLIRESCKIIDSIEAKEELEFSKGLGIVINNEYHTISDIGWYLDLDRKTKVFIIDLTQVPFEQVPPTIQTKILWNTPK